MQPPQQCSLLGCSQSEAWPAALLPKHAEALHVRRAHITVRSLKFFGECNKKWRDSVSWPCLGQQLAVISTIPCSVYFNKLLSISIKQGFKIPSFYSIFLPLDTQTHPSAAVKLKQWQQFERIILSGSSSRVCTHTPKSTFFNSFFFTKCIWKPYRWFLAGQWFTLSQQINL